MRQEEASDQRAGMGEIGVEAGIRAVPPGTFHYR
jgi:hypothetical protein